MSDKPLILVTNDDGITAPGIRALIEVMNEFGESTALMSLRDQHLNNNNNNKH